MQSEISFSNEYAYLSSKQTIGGFWWLMPVILTTWEMNRIMVQGQPRQIVHETFLSASKKEPEQNGLEVWLKW
jgi:hypothetical protein